MSFFKKSPGADAAAMARETMSRLVSAGETDISIIGPGMSVSGDVVTEGTVRIEGRIEGTVRAGRCVVLGKSGEVVGDIITQEAVIGGQVHGTVVAEDRLELQSTAVIDGEIRARSQHLQLAEGARFNGNIQMLEETPPMRALPAEAGMGSSEYHAQG
jgi:cytoskeletal protein CcmA (bactofilin family)